jgi:hypothetical protein
MLPSIGVLVANVKQAPVWPGVGNQLRRLKHTTWEVTRMKAGLFARPRSYRDAQYPVLYGLLALVSIGVSTATAQPRKGLVQQLDSIAGAGVREKRAVGIVAAVAKGKDTLLLKAYGKGDVEGDVPLTTDTIFQIGSTTKAVHRRRNPPTARSGQAQSRRRDHEVASGLPDSRQQGDAESPPQSHVRHQRARRDAGASRDAADA